MMIGCMMTASVANTLGFDLENTNIIRGSAWQKAQKERIKLADQIRDDFQKPIHWDGKILKVKGNHQTIRFVCTSLKCRQSKQGSC